MQNKTLIVLIAAAIMGVSSTAMAKGGGGKGGGGGHFHGHFHNHFHFDNRFLRNQALLNGWGWGGDCGWALQSHAPPMLLAASHRKSIIASSQAVIASSQNIAARSNASTTSSARSPKSSL